jgi:5-methylcytosine-specific restriction endonuclease McrA
MTYSEKLRDPRWQKKRLEVMERDGWRCLDCSSENKQLQVHHCVYSKEPWDVDPKYLMTLCEDCHTERQWLEHDAKMMIGQISRGSNIQRLGKIVAGLAQACYATPDNGRNHA